MQGIRVLQSPVNRRILRAYSNAVGLLLTIFVMVGEAAAQPCPNRYSPADTSPQLYINPEQWREMATMQNRLGDCPVLAADFALAWFWGAAGAQADASLAAHYAKLARGPQAQDQLRLLRAALVVAGLDDAFSLDEALRRIRREGERGAPIYADKALAYSNQLSRFMTSVSLDGRPGLALPDGGGWVVADAYGWPSRYAGSAEPKATPAARALFYTRSPFQRVRWWPSATGRQPQGVGRLYARYPEGDGWCTATAIAPRWLITAAHCLFEATAGDVLAKYLRFYLARPEGPGAGIGVKRAWALENRHQQLLNGNISAYAGSDLALLELTTGLGGEQPFVSLQLPGGGTQAVELLSYPGDRPAGSLWLSQCQTLPMVEGGGAMALVELSCRNRAGQSGALIRQPGIDGGAIGVLSANISRTGEDAVSVAGMFSHALLSDIEQIVSGSRPGLSAWREFRF